MKILNVNNSIDSLKGGGTAERTLQMSRFFGQKNYECTILTFNNNLDNCNEEEISRIKVIRLPLLSKRFYLPLGGFKKIKEAVHEADIIHLMNHWSILNAIVHYYSRRLRKPYVVCPAGSLLLYGRSKILKRLYNIIIGNNIIRKADAHIAIASNEFEHYQYYGIDKKNVSLIPNGIMTEDFKTNLPLENPKDLPSKYILFVGRLNFIKGPDLLLNAFYKISQEFSDYHLIFAGPDEGMLTTLKKLTDELDLNDKIHFIGCIKGRDKMRIYKNADFLVVPSRQEAMSIVVLEGGMFSKPALITNQCGFNILEKINGGYVVPATVEDIEQGLRKFISDSNLLLMGNNLKQYISQNHTWESIGEKILSLYKKILNF